MINTQASFRALPARKQFQIIEKLVVNAEEGNRPTDEVKELSRDLGLKHTAFLNAGLIEASEGMNAQDGGDGVQELAEALNLPEGKVDRALGSYAEELAKQTSHSRPTYGGGTT
jgi:phage I-like protein